jgi:putative sugar O-methyltransferase
MRRLAKTALRKFGFELVRVGPPSSLPDDELSHDETATLPHEAKTLLRSDNPRLTTLRDTYAELNLPVTDSFLWKRERVENLVDLRWFRGDNMYVWQRRHLGEDYRLKSYILYREVEAADHLGLLERLSEDGAFGCWTEPFGRTTVSRDLLDSINEINFLDRHVGLAERPTLRVLDIGAGYGRLAHRMAEALPNLSRYDCVDAIPESTFLSEYYLAYRHVIPPARVIPLDELVGALASEAYDLAVNIHSFSECTYGAVSWWIDRLNVLEVPWLLIVPNEAEGLFSTELDYSRRDCMSLLVDAGYRLELRSPVWTNPDVRELVGIDHQFLLFRR